jgi:HlyD family secretion protein
MKFRRLIVFILLVALLGGGFAAFRYFLADSTAPAYKFAAIESGPITATVAATGTLNPVVSVQVGSQVSGQLKEIFVDFNSPVQAGQLIARIDPETFQHKLRQAEADLEAMRAAVLTQRADLLRVEAIVKDAQNDYDRKKSLVAKNFISSADLDKAESTLNIARAQREVARAQVENGNAIVRQREALLAQARVDLGRTEIRSPVDGVVVKRSVDRGQTVAASLQAPELFIIAQNLTDMQVETSIDEADVGRIRLGQKATFTVDAFPGRQFSGEVRQIRKAAKIEANVVTYTVVVSANNPELSLLPGMTANVRVITAQKESVLKIANAALRFKPPQDADAKPEREPGQPPRGDKGKGGSKAWIVGENGKPRAVAVKLGLTDGTMTEITGGDLAAGTQVITGIATQASKPTAGGPRMF